MANLPARLRGQGIERAGGGEIRGLTRLESVGSARAARALLASALLVLGPYAAPAQTVSGSASAPASCLFEPGGTTPLGGSLSVSWEVPTSVVEGQPFDVVIQEASAQILFLGDLVGAFFEAENASPSAFFFDPATTPISQTLVATGSGGENVVLRYAGFSTFITSLQTDLSCTNPDFVIATIPIEAAPTPSPTPLPTPLPAPCMSGPGQVTLSGFLSGNTPQSSVPMLSGSFALTFEESALQQDGDWPLADLPCANLALSPDPVGSVHYSRSNTSARLRYLPTGLLFQVEGLPFGRIVATTNDFLFEFRGPSLAELVPDNVLVTVQGDPTFGIDTSPAGNAISLQFGPSPTASPSPTALPTATPTQVPTPSKKAKKSKKKKMKKTKKAKK